MSLPIVLRREADREYEEAATWYEEQRAGLGARLIERIESVLAQIGATPSLYPRVYGDARRAVVPEFPYNIVYRVEPERVLVLAIFHTSRDPAIWQRRM